MNAKTDSGVAFSDREAICALMEPIPELPAYWYGRQRSPQCWWELTATAGGGMAWYPDRLTLDRIYEVESQLTDGQWLQYGACCWKWYTEAATANDYEISHLNRWRRTLMHLTSDQKIKALAATIRVTNP